MYDDLIAAVSFADILAHIIAVAALIAAVLVGIRGVRWILLMAGGRQHMSIDDYDEYNRRD